MANVVELNLAFPAKYDWNSESFFPKIPLERGSVNINLSIHRQAKTKEWDVYDYSWRHIRDKKYGHTIVKIPRKDHWHFKTIKELEKFFEGFLPNHRPKYFKKGEPVKVRIGKKIKWGFGKMEEDE